jgi:hypothetical protein
MKVCVAYEMRRLSYLTNQLTSLAVFMGYDCLLPNSELPRVEVLEMALP